MKTNILNIHRLLQLMLNDIRLHAKTILITAATIVVLFALLPFHVTGNSSAYLLILYVGGFIVTGFAFNELHDRSRAHFYLMLPCSNSERFLSKWLLTSLGYAFGVLIIYYLFSLLSVAVNMFLFNRHVNLFDISQPNLWIEIGKYIILQSIILLGAITFKRFVLIKTALVLGCFLLVLSLLIGSVAWIFCPQCSQGWFLFSTLMKGEYFIFWIILAPFCWIVTYLRLTESELI